MGYFEDINKGIREGIKNFKPIEDERDPNIPEGKVMYMPEDIDEDETRIYLDKLARGEKI